MHISASDALLTPRSHQTRLLPCILSCVHCFTLAFDL